jgi:hypothetical protein
MLHTTFKTTLAALFVLAIAFTACNRSRTNNPTDEDDNFAKDNALSELFYNDALNMADEAAETPNGGNLSNYKMRSPCATVTHDTLSTPKTITIDFGPTNCLCGDGRYRRGKVLVSYTGAYKDSGHVHTISFDNYHVNDNKILGTKTVTNMGHNANNQMYFTISVNGLIIKANTNDSVIWNQNRVRTFLVGENTPSKMDDIYRITGNGTGQRANGTPYSMTITQPLIKALSCQWIQQGEIQVQPSGAALRTLNYGGGNCDNQATLTVNGNTINITLN